MKNKLYFKNFVQEKEFTKKSKGFLAKKFEKVIKQISQEIDKSSKTLNVLSKKFKFNFDLKDLQKYKKYNTIALIGMGGSILGSEAIHSFLEKRIKKKVYFFNNLDEKKIIDFKKKENQSNVLFIIISKSGNTLETLSNIFLLNILKKKAKNIIIISEKKNNSLFLLSKKLDLFYIEHKKNIGGRYSVLSEVGILPAYLMGLNIFKIRSKINDSFSKKNKSFTKESTTKLANLMNTKKFNNLVLLNYCPELEKFLFWCQQLLAESLGKKSKGFLPSISNAPKDHHSLLQLYLDGPRDKIFNIFSLEKNSNLRINLSKNKNISSYLNKKKISKIKISQKNALIKAFEKKKIPFREFRIKTINEEVLGKLFSIFIVETIILGKLLNINPFDQPAVEQVKIDTKNFLT
jgi:glucose-6-phosphate isomerase